MGANALVNDAIIIDDDPDVCQVCKMYLENMGCFRNIVISPDGVDATIKLQNQLFSVILLDINLPKKSGGVIMKHIKELGNNKINRIVVISGEIGKSFLSEALQLGVKHFLVKPFDEASFQEKILQVLKTGSSVKK